MTYKALNIRVDNGPGKKRVGFNKNVIIQSTHERNIEQYFIFCIEITGFYKPPSQFVLDHAIV